MLDQLCEDLKADEGWRAHVYDDATGQPIVPGSTVIGHPTIGYGFLVEAGKSEGLPNAIGETWLLHAASVRWWALTTRHPWLVEQPEDVQRAIGNMAYQIGVEGVSRFRRTLTALQDGDRALAAECALQSKWATQTPARANRVAALIRG